ncbi:MAG: hypothetical protein F4Z09_07295 [Rhodobacteraceae bacterium]|nr:hypothetical protein [Paracoccaceae bacterium]
MLPETIACEGEFLHNERNLIKKMTITNDDGKSIQVVVKAFKTLGLLRGFIDFNFRNSKAKRSMNNAIRILELGILTPDPIGCIECLEFNSVRQCYYISRYWEQNYDLDSLLYRGNSNKQISQIILRELAKFTAKQHDCGILHLDYNPGNILTRLQGDKVDFCLVDLNRLKFTHLGLKERISGLVRLSLCPDKMRIIGIHYANFTGMEQASFCRQLDQAYSQFWKKRIRLKRILSILK